jgi:3-oxoacyl-[acyl-carrier protein] reductase
MKDNILIFGGSKGIGREINKKLEKNYKTIILSRNIRNIKKNIKIDLEKKDEIKKFLNTVHFNNIRGLVFSQRYRGNCPEEENQVMLKATESIIDGLSNKMKKNSSIIIISSVCLDGVLMDQSLQYHLIKGSLDQLVRYMAIKLGEKKIRINAILATRLIKHENKKFYLKKNNKIRKNLEKITPLGRMSHAKDIANAVSFFMSNDSSFITGQSVKIDGGLSLINQEHILYT